MAAFCLVGVCPFSLFMLQVIIYLPFQYMGPGCPKYLCSLLSFAGKYRAASLELRCLRFIPSLTSRPKVYLLPLSSVATIHSSYGVHHSVSVFTDPSPSENCNSPSPSPATSSRRSPSPSLLRLRPHIRARLRPRIRARLRLPLSSGTLAALALLFPSPPPPSSPSVSFSASVSALRRSIVSLDRLARRHWRSKGSRRRRRRRQRRRQRRRRRRRRRRAAASPGC